MIPRAPTYTRYAAPTLFTTMNAVAEVARMAEMPSADAVACTRHPSPMPSVVNDAARRPPASVLRVTSAMSAPGKMVRSAARARKAQRWWGME